MAFFCFERIRELPNTVKFYFRHSIIAAKVSLQYPFPLVLIVLFNLRNFKVVPQKILFMQAGLVFPGYQSILRPCLALKRKKLAANGNENLGG